MKEKYLITTDSWFIAPDGLQYKAAWGIVEILQDSFLGVKTNGRSANWFAKVGSESKHVIIAGCQIHYGVRCKDEPKNHKIEDFRVNKDNSGVNYYDRPGYVYIAE